MAGLSAPLPPPLVPEPLQYEGPGVEIPLLVPEDGQTNFLLQLKLQFVGLSRCLAKMLR